MGSPERTAFEDGVNNRWTTISGEAEERAEPRDAEQNACSLRQNSRRFGAKNKNPEAEWEAPRERLLGIAAFDNLAARALLRWPSPQSKR